MPHYPYDAFRMFYVKIFSYFASNNISQTKSYIVMWICLIPSFFFYFSTVHQIHSVNKSIFEAYLFGGIPVRKLILPFICIILSNSYQTFPKWTCWLKTYLWPTSSKKKKKNRRRSIQNSNGWMVWLSSIMQLIWLLTS